MITLRFVPNSIDYFFDYSTVYICVWLEVIYFRYNNIYNGEKLFFASKFCVGFSSTYHSA